MANRVSARVAIKLLSPTAQADPASRLCAAGGSAIEGSGSILDAASQLGTNSPNCRIKPNPENFRHGPTTGRWPYSEQQAVESECLTPRASSRLANVFSASRPSGGQSASDIIPSRIYHNSAGLHARSVWGGRVRGGGSGSASSHGRGTGSGGATSGAQTATSRPSWRHGSPAWSAGDSEAQHSREQQQQQHHYGQHSSNVHHYEQERQHRQGDAHPHTHSHPHSHSRSHPHSHPHATARPRPGHASAAASEAEARRAAVRARVREQGARGMVWWREGRGAPWSGRGTEGERSSRVM